MPTLTREWHSILASRYEALKRGNSRSVRAAALTTKSLREGVWSDSLRAPRRSATTSDTSASADTVKLGISAADSDMRRAMVACVGVSSTTRMSPRASAVRADASAAVPAARCTSSRVILPPGPLPTTSWRESPSSTAVRRATGVALGCASAAAASFAGAGAGNCSAAAAPRPASLATGCPTAAVSPSKTRIASSVPSSSAS